jgi:hypothetical protein
LTYSLSESLSYFKSKEIKKTINRVMDENYHLMNHLGWEKILINSGLSSQTENKKLYIKLNEETDKKI